MNRDEIARTILRYVAEHSDSADTLEGIVTWWLMRQNIHERVEEVREALALLVAQGVLETRTAADNSVSYRVNVDALKAQNDATPQHGALQ